MDIGKNHLVIPAVVLAGMFLLASCSAPQPDDKGRDSVDPATTATSSLGMSSQEDQTARKANIAAVASGVSYDFLPQHTNDELAKAADVVTTGVIVKIQDGPVYGRFDDDFSDMGTVVLTIKAHKVAKGDVSEGDNLNLVMYTSALSELDAWNNAFPEGSNVAVYLTKMRTEAPTDPTESGIDVRGLERFGDADLYATGAQGFAVQVEGNAIYWPWTDVTREGAIEEALPGGTAVGVLTEQEASRINVED